MLFTEEIGELAKAIRKTRRLYQEHARQNTLNLEEEFADVLSYLLDLANYFQVDLEQAFRAKEAVNATLCADRGGPLADPARTRSGDPRADGRVAAVGSTSVAGALLCKEWPSARKRSLPP